MEPHQMEMDSGQAHYTTQTGQLYSQNQQHLRQDQQHPKVYTDYKRLWSTGLGIAQIVLGSALIIINSVAISIGLSLSFISSGIWGGLLCIGAGILGVLASKYRTAAIIRWHLGICVASTLAAVVGAVASGLGAFDESFYYVNNYRSRIATLTAQSVLHVLEFCVAIRAMELCSVLCAANCDD